MTDRPLFDTIGYIRVSTEQQAGEERTSLPEQRRALTAHAVKLGRVLQPAAVFEDPGASGATAEGRPGFMAMLAYCEAYPRPLTALGAVFVLNDSRFGRFDDPEEATHWRFVLKKLGWIVRFVEGDDVENVMARGMIRFVGAAQATPCPACGTDLIVESDAIGRTRMRCPKCDRVAPPHQRHPDEVLVPQTLVRAGTLPVIREGQLRCQVCAKGVKGHARFCTDHLDTKLPRARARRNATGQWTCARCARPITARASNGKKGRPPVTCDDCLTPRELVHRKCNRKWNEAHR